MTKRKLLIISVSVIAVVALIIVSLALFQKGDSSDQPGVLSLVEGNVLVMKLGTNKWTEARAGHTVEEGDIVRTGADSRADITFFEGTTIEIQAGTEIKVNAQFFSKDRTSTTILLEQELGKSISRVKKLTDPASRYEIGTPSGVAAARGTTFVVAVDKAGVSRVLNEEGSVVAISQGVEVQIPEGLESIMIPGQPPSSPASPSGGGAGSIRIAKAIMSQDANTITYIYEVTNIGNASQINVFVSDNEVKNIEYIRGDQNNNGALDPGEIWIFTGTQSIK